MSGLDLGDWSSITFDGGDYSAPASNIGDVFSGFSAAPAPSGLSGFWDNLTGQFKQIGQNAINNPLGALTTALGAYGSYRENTGGKIPEGTVDAVQQLMMKGDSQNAYTPQPVKYNKPVARDWRHFVQSFDQDGNATQESRNDAHTNDMYQKVLGRNADVGGLKHWSGTMDKGMTAGQLERELMLSPENQINKSYRSLLARDPDFGGMNFYNDAMNKGLRVDQLREQLATSPEMQMGHLYRENLGRNPDPEGLAYFSDALKRGLTMEELKAQLMSSPEGQQHAAARNAAPVAGGLSQATNPAPGVPTAVNKVPRNVFPDDQLYNLE